MPPTQPSLTSFTQRLFNDFEFFVEQIWLDRGLDRVAPLGELERDILRFAAGADASWGWFRVVLASRGVGKTHLAVATLALWRLFRDNDRRILIVSKSEKHARDTITTSTSTATGE